MRFDILGFLKLYRQHPCLWDKKDIDYKNRYKRDAAEAALMKVTNFSNTRELRAKIRSIRGTYNNELRKVRKSMKSRVGVTYTPKLRWYQYADAFLCKNHTLDADPTSNLSLFENDLGWETPKEEPEDEDYREWGTAEELVEERGDTRSQSPEDPLSSHGGEVDTPEDMTEKVNSICEVGEPRTDKPADGSLKEALETLQVVICNMRDEFGIFGQQVAVQLSKLSARKAIEVQYEIAGILTAARLSELPP